ncbi:MAG: hypothetical protein ONB37_13300 [candidate division KSB1 bacterium]|nr:hypothetical protein [candidate division KSB1 bacterium]
MIFVECNADKTLLTSLGIQAKDIYHVFSKGNVCNRLRKNKNCIGLVDEDPDSGQPQYLETLALISDKNDVKVLNDKNNQNYLIVLCPRLEDWIVAAAQQAEVDLASYNLPANGNALHKVVNVRLADFERLIKELKKSSKMVEYLVSLLPNG